MSEVVTVYMIYIIIKKSNVHEVFKECTYISNVYGYLDYSDYDNAHIGALYAWTKDKKLKSRFMKYRNKKYFYCESVSMSGILYSSLVHQQSSLEIVDSKLTSPEGDVEIPTVRFEYEFVSDPMTFVDCMLFDHCFDESPPPFYPPPHIFTQDIWEALRILGYIDFWYSYVSEDADEYEAYMAYQSECTKFICGSIDEPNPIMRVNELRTFLVQFHIILSDELNYKIGGDN